MNFITLYLILLAMSLFVSGRAALASCGFTLRQQTPWVRDCMRPVLFRPINTIFDFKCKLTHKYDLKAVFRLHFVGRRLSWWLKKTAGQPSPSCPLFNPLSACLCILKPEKSYNLVFLWSQDGAHEAQAEAVCNRHCQPIRVLRLPLASIRARIPKRKLF